MNLAQSLNFSALGQTPSKLGVPQGKTSAKKIAKKIFAMAEAEGRPFEKISARDWRNRWLASEEFVLMEIEISKAALPGMPRNPNRVFEKMQAAASSLEPVVVDINKQNIGQTPSGYVPRVIVVDGKHTHMARRTQGYGTILAWVGQKALKYVLPQKKEITIRASKTNVKTTKIDAAVAVSVPRQDRAQAGSAPHQNIPSEFPTKGNGNLDWPPQPVTQSPRKFRAGGAGAGAAGSGAGGASGSLGGGSGANPNRMGVYANDASDTGQVDPSDADQGTASTLQDPTDYTQESPAYESPGSGVGPRTKKSTGATNSELSQKTVRAGGPGSGRHKEVHISPGTGYYQEYGGNIKGDFNRATEHTVAQYERDHGDQVIFRLPNGKRGMTSKSLVSIKDVDAAGKFIKKIVTKKPRR